MFVIMIRLAGIGGGGGGGLMKMNGIKYSL